MLITLATQAQIKVLDNGHVSLGSLTNNYGVQVGPNGYTFFRTQNNMPYGWGNLSIANNFHQKHWIIENQYLPDSLGLHMFFVYGNGHVYSKGYYIITSLNGKTNREEIEPIDGRLALSTILGINGYYYKEDQQLTTEDIENNEYVSADAVEGMILDLEKRHIGLSGDNLAELLPEAVRTDPEARICIDYHAVVTFLIEAMKEQQNEIEMLQRILEENGLLNNK